MRTLLRLLVPHWARLALATTLGAAVIASNMGLLAAAAYLIAAASTLHLMALLIFPMYLVRLLSATRGAARYAERLVSHRVTFDILARLRVRLYDRLRLLGPAGLRGGHSGDALRRVIADVDRLQDAYLLLVSPIAVAMGVAALLTATLLVFSSAMAWAVLGVLLCCGAVLPLAVLGLSSPAGRAVVEARAELNAHLVDSIQGSRDIVSNGAGSRYLAGTAALGRRAAAAETHLALVSAGREGATELLTSLAMLMALALAIPLVTRHAIAPLYVAVPALLTLAAFEAVRPVGLAAEAMGSIRMAGQRVLTLGDAAEPVPEPAESLPLQPPYSIAFEDVTLTYPGALRPALQNVHLEVPAGSRVAVVGASGAGKTTLARLLTRALDPGTGRVLIGGTDVRRCSLRELRRTVGVVAQDTHIFDDTVRNNLLAARPGASTEELEAALEAVGLLDVARARAGGLDMWVGEHGERLSGGERQRLAVARLLLQDTPIVLLDEVTANLDPVTESALLTMLFRATRGRTVLTITHRLVGMERMDEIVVLDRGRVVERGTHATLCRAGSVYKRMLDVQENMLAV